MSRSRTKPRDTRPNLDYRCDSMSRTEDHVPLATKNMTTEHATRPPTRPRMCGAWRLCPPWCAYPVCLPRCQVSVCLSVLPALNVCLPRATTRIACSGACRSVFNCSARCSRSVIPVVVRAARACGVLVCLRMFTQHAARWSRSDILPWATPFCFFQLSFF